MSARSASSSLLSSASEILEVSRTSGDENEKSKLTYPIINVKGGDPKKKPYDVKFSKYNPKINPNIKYSSKQAYRQYKSKVEPNLHKKIMIEEEDDLVKKIKKAFGIKPENTNFTDVESAPFESTYAKFPENKLFNETVPSISEMEIDDDELLLYAVSEYNLSGRQRQYFGSALIDAGSKFPNLTKRQSLDKSFKLMDDLFGNIQGKLTREDLPKIKEIKSLSYEKANDFYKNSMLSSEKRQIAREYANKETNPDSFITATKKIMGERLKSDRIMKDLSKEFEEVMLEPASRAKANLKSQSTTAAKKQITSPTPTERSEDSTVGGEITTQNIGTNTARRSIGRPATRPETIAKQIVNELVDNVLLDQFLKANK